MLFLFCITKIMLLFEKCKLSWYKFLVKCFQSISENVVKHISESRSYTCDESDRDCTPNDCPNDSADSFKYCFHNVVVRCCSYFVIQRYNKKMRYANFSAINCRNNNYFLEKSDIRILRERLDHVFLVMVNAVNLKLAAVERKGDARHLLLIV